MQKDIVFNRAQKHLRKNVWEAWQDYQLIENGDKVMVCLSGGKTAIQCLIFYCIIKKNLK